MPPNTDRARDAGASAVLTVRRLLARKAAELIRNDPEAAEMALDIGLVDPRWLDDPGSAPLSTVAPYDVVERFLERAVEQRPSRFSALGLGAAQLLSTRLSPPKGKSEPLTVVFTDLEGFTAYTATNGDEAALRLLNRHHHDARLAVRKESGRIVKRLGDGLLCTFAHPALGMRAAVSLLDTAPEPLRLRAGVHMGEAIVSPDDVIGHVVNVAARVAESARGGQVLATASTVDGAGPTPGIKVGKLRSRKLKGVVERVGVAEIWAEGPL